MHPKDFLSVFYHSAELFSIHMAASLAIPGTRFQTFDHKQWTWQKRIRMSLNKPVVTKLLHVFSLLDNVYLEDGKAVV